MKVIGSFTFFFSSPNCLKANPFCLSQFNGRVIFGKRPESRSLTVVYFDLDTHPFLSPGIAFFILHITALLLILVL